MVKSEFISREKPKLTFHLLFGVVMSVIGSSFQFGYNIAVMNAPTKEIQNYFFNCNETGNLNENVTECTKSYQAYRDNMYAIAVAVFAFSGMIGALLVGTFVGKFGRRGGLMMNNLISFAAAVCLGAAKYANSFSLIILGRALIGIFSGLTSGMTPMYIGEIAPRTLRGAFGIAHQILLTIGILVAQIFGLEFILGTEKLWPFLLAFTCVPSLIQAICIPYMPRSPRFILIDLGHEAAAMKELIKLRGTDDVSAEMDEMKEEAKAKSQTRAMSIFQLIHKRSLRWQLITILAMMMAQQLSGINAVFFYANKIFDAAKIPEGNPQDFASVGIGAVNVFMSILAASIIEKAGRKKLLVFGFGAMAFWCLALTITLNVLISLTKNGNTTWVSYLSIACVVGYVIGFSIGPGPVPWIMSSEFFTQDARPAASMLSCVANWMCNFLIGIGFPAVVNATGPYVFIGFMVVSIIITIYLQIVMPETKNRTFAEINALFDKRNGYTVAYHQDDEDVIFKKENC